MNRRLTHPFQRLTLPNDVLWDWRPFHFTTPLPVPLYSDFLFELLIASFSLTLQMNLIQTPARWFGSVQFSRSVVPESLQPHRLQHTRPPCPSPNPKACSNSCPLSWQWHPTISSSVIPFSSCLQSFPASWSFPMSQFFAAGGQRIGASASASVLPMNIQDWFPLGWTGWISLQS